MDTKTVKSKPLVSILIACYNGENYINKCIKSCINQTYRNIEIVVINDGSTDNSEKVLKWWTKIDNRIRVVNNTNHGLGETRNFLIQEAQGEYFTFLDIDDWLNLDSVEKLINKASNENLDIVVGRTNYVYDNKYIKKLPFLVSWWVPTKMTNYQYVKSNICTPWASIIKTDFFKSLKINFLGGRVFEDFGVMSFVYMKANAFATIKDVVYNYHRYKKEKQTQTLSAFNSQCFKKSNDIFWQTKQLMHFLNKNGLLKTKKQKKSVNGVLFQIVSANIFLSSNLTKNKYFRYLINYDLIQMVLRYGLNLKYSKTLWKSLAFFFILFKNYDLFKHISKKKRWSFKITGTLKSHQQGYSLINGFSSNVVPSRFKIYKFSPEEILNYSIDDDSKNTNVALEINEWNDKIDDCLKIMKNVNCVPFAIINSNDIPNEKIKFLQEETLGLFIDLRTVNLKKYKEILDTLYSTKREKIVFLISKPELKDKIENDNYDILNGVFWDE